jgi:hypothetical protein
VAAAIRQSRPRCRLDHSPCSAIDRYRRHCAKVLVWDASTYRPEFDARAWPTAPDRVEDPIGNPGGEGVAPLRSTTPNSQWHPMLMAAGYHNHRAFVVYSSKVQQCRRHPAMFSELRTHSARLNDAQRGACREFASKGLGGSSPLGSTPSQRWLVSSQGSGRAWSARGLRVGLRCVEPFTVSRWRWPWRPH